MDSEILALRLHNAQLAAALRAIVDRDLSYLDGFVCGGVIPWNSIRQAREVVRATGNAVVSACPTHGTERTPGCSACRKLIDAEVQAEVAAGVEVVPQPHLQEEAPPLMKCTACGRKSWDEGERNKYCDMPQPGGERCNGRLRALGVGGPDHG